MKDRTTQAGKRLAKARPAVVGKKSAGRIPGNGREQLRFERLRADRSSRFINLPADQVDPVGGPPALRAAKRHNGFPWRQRRMVASKTRRNRFRLGTLLLTLAALGASAAAPKRVLILDSFGRDVAPFSVGVSTFRTTLARELGQPVDIYESPLDMARFAKPGYEEPLADFLEHRFDGSPIDLVVPVGAPAVQFVAQYRLRLFAETPLLFMGVEPRRVPPDALNSNATLVTQKVDLPGMIEDILQLRPDTTNIAVVIGSSPLEKFWGEERLREWQAFTNRVGFSVLENLSLAQIQERVRKLPPRSFVVSAMLIMDADRVPYDGFEALEAIHAAANAPVFGYYRSHLGRGAIGGRLYQDSQVGMEAARVAVRILRGESASDIPPVILGASPPTYDWRELTRWGIRPDRLPTGSVIEFRALTFWEQYRWRVVGVVAFCFLQTALIVGLLVNRAKRREDQAMATLIADLSSRFINLPADQVDPEISAAQQRVCDALGLDVSSLWQWRPDNPAMHTLTHYYRPLGGPPVPQTMKGQDYFPWCQRRVLAGEVVAVSSLADFPAEAARDREVFGFYGLKTTLTIPLAVGGGPVFGSVNFNDMRRERRWSEALIQRLQLVAQIFANALARKVADQALRESEARLSLAADAAEIGLWSLNLATDRFWLTDKARALLKFSSGEDLALERFLSRVHPDDRAPVQETIQSIVRSRGESQLQYRVVWPDGRVRWMLSRGRVRCGVSGEPECLMGITVDVTERRQAEMEAQRNREEIAHLSRVAMLGELSGALAHELNQPLTAILSNAQAALRFLAGEDYDLDEVRDILKDIVADDRHAGEVIRRLRVLLKKGEFQLQPLDVNEVVQDVLNLVRTGLLNHGIGVQTDFATNLPPVKGDRVQLQQVLLNLIVNASDAMTGTVPADRQMTVRTAAADGYVRVSVADRGIGIAPEVLAQMFNSFFTTKANGLGLGLPISRSIISAHGGRLTGTNNPDGGATFEFVLPVDDERRT